ncbi:MAG: class I SAM-dependent methyltransferase [Anaerolineae bacterium]
MTNDSIVFDRAAGYYDETRGFPPGEDVPAAALIARAGSLTPESRVLEIGVGTGRIAVPLLAHLNHSFGVDLSVPMMERLRAKPGSEKISLAISDARRLPFPTHTFDAMVVVHVFHLIPDMSTAVHEAARVVKPVGVMLHCYNERESALEALRPDTNPSKGPYDRTHRWNRITSELEQAGWQHRDTLTHSFPFSQSPAEFVDYFRARKWSGTWEASEEEHQKAIAHLEARVNELFPDATAPVEGTMKFKIDVLQPPQ